METLRPHPDLQNQNLHFQQDLGICMDMIKVFKGSFPSTSPPPHKTKSSSPYLSSVEPWFLFTFITRHADRYDCNGAQWSPPFQSLTSQPNGFLRSRGRTNFKFLPMVLWQTSTALSQGTGRDSEHQFIPVGLGHPDGQSLFEDQVNISILALLRGDNCEH